MEKQEFLNRYLVNRQGTSSSKWDGLKGKFGEDGLLPMWIADMEFKTPEAVTAALQQRIDHGVFGYSFVPDSYYEAFQNWMETRHNCKIEREELRFSTGCVTGISWMIHAFTEPGDTCLILTPIYYPFYNVVTNNDRRLATVGLDYDEGYFTMNYEAIEKAIVEQDVKMFLMCSPHNPAGRVWTEEELDKVLAICQKHNVLVVSDEIHQDLMAPGHSFIPAANVGGGKYRDILLILNSATKSFNLATLIHSHIIIFNEELRKVYDRFASGLNRTEVSVMGMIATEAAYRDGGEWLDALRQVIHDNYIYLKERFAAELPGVRMTALEGAYLPMVDLRAYVTGDACQEVIQGKCKLAVDYGQWFGEGYDGFIRVNVATDPAIIQEAADRIIREIKALGTCNA
ncbi:MAG: pyridoxal phosphate-dependent aminotransferase [Clostridiales bacterium]|nr:pyridoxal phosphate-dependent aminotransferase [Clostridiales bacterium]